MKKDFLKLVESELDKAEITLAVKSIGDDFQKAASTLTKKTVNEIPAVVEKIKGVYGIEKGTEFNDMINNTINSTIQSLLKYKAEMDNQVLMLTGEAPDTMTSLSDMGSDADDDVAPEAEASIDDKLPKQKGLDIDKSFDNSDDVGPPLGRNVKESIDRISGRDTRSKREIIETIQLMPDKALVKMAKRDTKMLSESRRNNTNAARAEAKKRKLI